MKKISLLFVFVLVFGAANFASAQMANWKQQKDFHTVMSDTWHPAEKGDMQPIKMRSMELVSKAEMWKASAIPAEIADKKAVKKSLRNLVKDTKKVNRGVKNGMSDRELTAQLAKTHDTYHGLVGLCKDTEGAGHDDHDDHTGHNH